MNLEEITHNGYRWINITDPDQEMVNFLQENFHFHPLDLEDVLSKTGYPKIDAYQDYLFIVLQFPVYEKERRIYKRAEVDIFLSHNYLITISDRKLISLQNFFETCKIDELARQKFLGRGIPMLLYEMTDALLDYVFPIISQKNELIFQLEKEIFETPEMKDMIHEIMILKRNIINIRRIIIPQRTVLTDLQNKYRQFIPQELNLYFDDLLDKKDKIISQLDTASEYVNVLEDANEALLTRNTNKVIKTLTVFSVIVLPMNLIMNYYSMNVPVPLQHNPNILTYLNIVFLFSFIVMMAYFVKRRWL